jgi:hypothetical protein
MTDNENELHQDSVEPVKRAYHTPVIKRYGSLAGLVQATNHVGNDGGIYSDCTRS